MVHQFIQACTKISGKQTCKYSLGFLVFQRFSVAEVGRCDFWWLVRVTLVVAFCPKILGGGKDL